MVNVPIRLDEPKASLIGVDWGSTRLRAFLIGAGGNVIETRSSDQGISASPPSPQNYIESLDNLVGDWIRAQPFLSLVACGMVGSKHGWVEVPYVDCPSGVRQLIDGACKVNLTNGQLMWIIPGLLHDSLGVQDAPPDVMRGEETQIVGALQFRPDWGYGCCLVLPGTHSKWVQVKNHCVQAFTTHMTGELFAVLRTHSVLGRLMSHDTELMDSAFFLQGVAAARSRQLDGLSRQLFAVRSLGLTGRLPDFGIADYLSGLLIGHELLAGLAWRAAAGFYDAPLVLIGEPAICDRYLRAFRYFGIEVDAALPNSAPAGLWHLASSAGWTRTEIVKHSVNKI